MSVDMKKAFEEVVKYREGLINYGREVVFTNPDRLSDNELKALVYTIFEHINELDMACGLPYHNTGMPMPNSVSKDRANELFVDFLDWYEIIQTPANKVYSEVVKNFPVSKYKRVLCVGDGMCSHLGRKLAEAGYEVVSVDPYARKEFSGKAKNGKGKLHVTKSGFYRTSKDMQDWADLIVGSKITEFVEEVVEAGKPAVFTISDNAEIYKMRYKGRTIRKSKDLDDELAKVKGMTVKRVQDGFDDDDFTYLYCYNPIERGLDR